MTHCNFHRIPSHELRPKRITIPSSSKNFMRIHRLIITTSFILCAWLAASFFYATPRDIIIALEGAKKSEVHASAQSAVVGRDHAQSPKD